MKRFFLFFYLAIFISLPIFSQPSSLCGTDFVEAQLQQSDPDYFQKTVNLDYRLKREILDQRAISTRNSDTVIYTIPMVFHILYEYALDDISDSKVYQEIDNLNEAFRNIGFYDSTIGADARIQFCLAKLDTAGNFTSGIRHIETFHANSGDDFGLKRAFNWDPTKYLNVYVATTLLGSSGIQGYAYYPGNHGQFYDGIVMRNRLIGNSKESSAIFAHEVGHYLGLPHPFNQGCSNNDCLLEGDRVCDTPPDNNAEVYEGCREVNHCTTDADDTSPNNPFTTDVPDLNNLYMDYNNQACQNAFTPGQVERMRIVLPVVRASLLQSNVCQLPSGLDAGISGILQPVITQCEEDLNVKVEVRNFGLAPLSSTNIIAQIDNGSVTAINWNGNLSYTEIDTFSFPISTSLSPGIHELKIYSSFPNGAADMFAANDTFRVLFNYLPAVEPPFYEDFENGLPVEWTIDNPGGTGWELTSYGCDSLGNPGQSFYIDNTTAYVSGLEDRLISPLTNLVYTDSAVLKFDIAFPNDSALRGQRERFIVSYSLDCGKTFEENDFLFNRGGLGLASTIISIDTANGWAPSSCDDWQTFEVPLDSLYGEEVVFSFNYLKFDNGFPLYLDNIRVEGYFTTNIEAPSIANHFSVYPNPGKGNYQVELELKNKSENASLIIRNMHGQTVKSVTISNTPEQQLNVDISSFSSGIYFFELETGQGRMVKKVMKW